MDSPRRKAFWWSFVIYLAPVSPADFPGRSWISVLLSPRISDDYGIAIYSGYLLLSVLGQVLAFLTLRALFRRTKSPTAAAIGVFGLWLASWIPIPLAAVWIDSRLVPRLMREPESAPLDGQEVCRFPNAFLLSPAYPRFAFLERAGVAWVFDHATRRPTILAKDCQLTAFAKQDDSTKTDLEVDHEAIVSFDMGGVREMMAARRSPNRFGRTWMSERGYRFTQQVLQFQRSFAPGGCALYDFFSQTSSSIPYEPGSNCPVLAGDGMMLADLEGTPYSVDIRRASLQGINGTPHGHADISKIGEGFVVIEDLSSQARELLLRRQSSRTSGVKIPEFEARGLSFEYAVIGFDGGKRWTLQRQGEAEDGGLIVDLPDWVSWRNGASHSGARGSLDWNIGGKPGGHRVTRGREITGVSLGPGGAWIAVSVTDRDQTGEVEDAVYVIRPRDGQEAFRQNLPARTLARVQFVDRDVLAYTSIRQRTPSGVQPAARSWTSDAAPSRPVRFDGSRSDVRLVRIDSLRVRDSSPPVR